MFLPKTLQRYGYNEIINPIFYGKARFFLPYRLIFHVLSLVVRRPSYESYCDRHTHRMTAVARTYHGRRNTTVSLEKFVSSIRMKRICRNNRVKSQSRR